MIYFIYVLKMGGSVLTDPDQIKKTISTIQKIVSEGKSVVVVVSALKGETNKLDEIASKLQIEDKADRAEIISMGERVSARIMVGALRANGIDAVLVDPQDELWPVHSSGDYLNADVEMDKTREDVQKKLLPLLKEGKVPVVCGFIGLNEEKKIQTLGRGGSDTTAVVLGNALNAREVVLFKDVGIAFSGDPKKAQNVKALDELDIDEALALSAGGSGLIHYKAFKYLNTVLRITSLEAGLSSGTIVNPTNGIGVSITANDVSMVTIIPDNESSELLQKVASVINSIGSQIYGMFIGSKAVLLYVSERPDLYQKIHESLVNSGGAKAVSVMPSLSEITVKSFDLEATPGYLNMVVSPLAEKGINIYGITTATSSIKVYVSTSSADEALNLIKQRVEM
ncbi:MAG: hypothetical protein ACP5LF_02330 [Nitrososphaeria archaeon]|nr:hypothetical protein [Conexivisphaerales archaeon]